MGCLDDIEKLWPVAVVLWVVVSRIARLMKRADKQEPAEPEPEYEFIEEQYEEPVHTTPEPSRQSGRSDQSNILGELLGQTASSQPRQDPPRRSPSVSQRPVQRLPAQPSVRARIKKQQLLKELFGDIAEQFQEQELGTPLHIEQHEEERSIQERVEDRPFSDDFVERATPSWEPDPDHVHPAAAKLTTGSANVAFRDQMAPVGLDQGIALKLDMSPEGIRDAIIVNAMLRRHRIGRTH